MWDLIVSVPDHCLSFYSIKYVFSDLECYFLKNIKTLDDTLLAVGINSYAFSIHRPA